MKRFFVLLLCFGFLYQPCRSQGCVAIRNLSGFSQLAGLGYGQSNNKWMLDVDNRYFEAYNLFEGKQNTGYSDSINIYEYTLNLRLSHVINNEWSYALDVPIAANTISSRVEH